MLYMYHRVASSCFTVLVNYYSPEYYLTLTFELKKSYSNPEGSIVTLNIVATRLITNSSPAPENHRIPPSTLITHPIQRTLPLLSITADSPITISEMTDVRAAPYDVRLRSLQLCWGRNQASVHAEESMNQQTHSC